MMVLPRIRKRNVFFDVLPLYDTGSSINSFLNTMLPLQIPECIPVAEMIKLPTGNIPTNLV